MPVNYLIIESLQKFHHYYGDDFKIECPTGSGQYITINQVAQELSRRVVSIFSRDSAGRRAVRSQPPMPTARLIRRCAAWPRSILLRIFGIF